MPIVRVAHSNVKVQSTSFNDPETTTTEFFSTADSFPDLQRSRSGCHARAQIGSILGLSETCAEFAGKGFLEIDESLVATVVRLVLRSQ